MTQFYSMLYNPVSILANVKASKQKAEILDELRRNKKNFQEDRTRKMHAWHVKNGQRYF